MAVDAERDLLYVSTASALYFKGFRQEDFNKSGIFKFKLSRMDRLAPFVARKCELAHSPTSVAA